MAIRGIALTVIYKAWDASANAPKTGDVGNHTLRVIKDGTAAAPTNAASEVDATNAKGDYKITLTATEMTCDCIKLTGVSSTANVALFGPQITTDHGAIATVAPGVWDELGASHLVAGSFGEYFQVFRRGTAQAGAAGSITLDAGANSTVDNFYQNTVVQIVGGTGAGQSRGVSAYTAATRVATVYQNWGVTPDNTSVFLVRSAAPAGPNFPTNWPLFAIDGNGRVDLSKVLGSTVNALQGGRVDSYVGATAATLVFDQTGNVSGSVGSVTGAVGSVTGAVGSITGVTFPAFFGSFSIDSNGRVKCLAAVQKNVALANFVFLMTDAVTHAPATGLTVAVTRSIDGAAFAGGTLGSVTEVANGMYKVNLAAGDLNGNVIVLKATATGADTTFERFMTFA